VKLAFVALAALLAIGATAPSAARTPMVARGVTVNGVRVGGLGSETARDLVRDRFGRALKIFDGSANWKVSPESLGVRESVDRAVTSALEAPAGTAVRLPVAVSARSVREYVASLDRKYSKAPRDARLVGVTRLSPVIAEGVPGRRVARIRMERRIENALRSPAYRTIGLATAAVSPKVTRKNFGPVIVIGRVTHSLRLFDGGRLVQQFGVATGQPAYPTPLGTYAIVDMQENPWWIPPPDAPWAVGAKPIPPGPGNPLGTRWMGLSAPGVGIHGTPDAASIGYSESHGCIRMHIPDAEWLFDHVRVGTPVAIVDA
jgi:lipoprotein-anchoring transpeptidase ErfK/SrfK